jgi:hypothetical protein
MRVLEEILAEYQSAAEKFPPFNTAHEGYAVLLEELDELWQHVKVRQGMRITHRMRHEAIQVAAMAMRFAVDVCDGGRGQR